MRPINKTALLVLLAFVFYILASLPLGRISAAQNQTLFQKDLCYDIYYVLEDGAQCVANVKIVGFVEINGASFLEVQPMNFPQEKSGYILFSSVRTILPVGTVRPQGFSAN
jgi:ABC-type dipeptide/oligopeptide/nickel transport system permease component